jgi:hypothetical protein
MMIPAMHAFDTHKYIKELTKSGFKEAQAEIIIKSILESRDYDFTKLATKEQVALIEKEMSKFATKEQLASIETDVGFIKQEVSKCATKEQLATMEERFMGRISASENTQIKWMVPVLLTTWAMVVGIAFKLFSH